MVIPDKVINAFDIKITEWDNKLNLKKLVPNFHEIKDRVILSTNKIYASSDIELKDLELLKNNRRRTKNRWIRAEIEKDINPRKMKNLTEWNDINIPLIMFPYISNKVGKPLTSAIKNDMTVELYTLILNKDEIKEDELKKNEKRELSSMPYVLTSFPYNNSKNGKFEDVAKTLSTMDDSVKATETSISTSKYSFHVTLNDEEAKTMLQLTSTSNTKKALDKINQLINITDRAIYNYILSRRGASFVEKGIIEVPEIDVINNVFNSNGKENYDIFRASLTKMSSIKGYIGGSIYYTEVGLISRKSTVSKNGVRTAVIEIHSYIRDEIIKKQTINLYKDIIDTCPNADCELLLFFLQRKRLGRILSKKPLKITVNYFDYFSEALIFSNKRKDRNIARLVEALEFVKNTNCIIEFFERKKDDITLIFKEMTEAELADLDYEDIFSDEFAEFRNKLIDEPEHKVIE